MFTTAIEKLSQFTRPIHTIERNFNSTTIRPGAATLFFVNESGVAITCKHVAEVMFQADQLAARYTDFKNKKKSWWPLEIIIKKKTTGIKSAIRVY